MALRHRLLLLCLAALALCKPNPTSLCSSLKSGLSSAHLAAQATSFCASFLSIPASTVTSTSTQTTATCTVTDNYLNKRHAKPTPPHHTGSGSTTVSCPSQFSGKASSVVSSLCSCISPTPTVTATATTSCCAAANPNTAKCPEDQDKLFKRSDGQLYHLGCNEAHFCINYGESLCTADQLDCLDYRTDDANRVWYNPGGCADATDNRTNYCYVCAVDMTGSSQVYNQAFGRWLGSAADLNVCGA